MAGQGAITRATANRLRENGWQVVYLCVPNTPHLNVVPIPTGHGISKQRYPDILAYKDGLTKLVEVEIKLTEDVARDIITRFQEMITALNNVHIWEVWREKVSRDTGHSLPEPFISQCDLIICSNIRPTASELIRRLQDASITVASADTYSP